MRLGSPRRAVVLLVFALAASSAGSRGTTAQGRAAIHGIVQVLMPDGSTQPAQDAVIWIADAAFPETAAPVLLNATATSRPAAGPASGPASGASTAARSAMQSKGKRFEPHVVALPAGATVDFPNVDNIFHNAFSVSPGNQFDLGLYRKGASKAVTFVRPGVVRVYCNIHQDMAGYVLVLDRGVSIVTGRDGSFRLADVPPGRRQIHVWHEMGGTADAPLDLQAGGDRVWNVQLDARQFRREPHTNKYGKKYPPVGRDADRY